MKEFTMSHWDVWESHFPTAGTLTEKLRFLLSYAILAPSTHNTQPWLFRIVDDTVELYADRTRQLATIDPDGRELTMSCGAALFFLRIAIRHFGFNDEVEIMPSSLYANLLARIKLGEKREALASEHALFAAFSERHTNRQSFERRDVPASFIATLQELAHEEDAWLFIVQGDENRKSIADLIARGDLIQWSDEEYRRERADWSRPNKGQLEDGIPGYAHGQSDLVASVSPLVQKTFNLGKIEASKDHQLAIDSPILAVLGTDTDTAYHWITAGQALGHILLYARTQDIWASFLNQPIEVNELRFKLHTITEQNGYPQLLFRMGYASEVRSTPRRPLSEVLI